jgi:hypothetical protein
VRGRGVVDAAIRRCSINPEIDTLFIQNTQHTPSTHPGVPMTEDLTSGNASTPLPPASDAGLEDIVSILQDTRPWLRFMSVLGFITCGLVCLGGILAGFLAGGQLWTAPVSLLVALVYIVLAGIILIPTFHLHHAANTIRALDQDRGTAAIAEPLRYQFRYWRFTGIMIIVCAGLYVALIIIALVIGNWLPRPMM